MAKEIEIECLIPKCYFEKIAIRSRCRFDPERREFYCTMCRLVYTNGILQNISFIIIWLKRALKFCLEIKYQRVAYEYMYAVSFYAFSRKIQNLELHGIYFCFCKL
jgi:hypothetical protein